MDRKARVMRKSFNQFDITRPRPLYSDVSGLSFSVLDHSSYTRATESLHSLTRCNHGKVSRGWRGSILDFDYVAGFMLDHVCSAGGCEDLEEHMGCG